MTHQLTTLFKSKEPFTFNQTALKLMVFCGKLCLPFYFVAKINAKDDDDYDNVVDDGDKYDDEDEIDNEDVDCSNDDVMMMGLERHCS